MVNNKIENAIEFVNISKSFGKIKANKNISFSVKKGTIHALIGENGAGKSTLMSILFGLYEPDEGFIKVNDKKTLILSPNQANDLGIGMVHQHFKLVNVYKNIDNIILGDETTFSKFKIINRKPSIKKIQNIQEKFNLHFDLNKQTGTEPVSIQQKVEIMKMLYRDSEILIFDEPTAVLTDEEIQGLLQTFRLFKEQGKTIIFISHKLKEIKQVADYATILRHGEVTGNFKVADTSVEEMAKLMVGGQVETILNSHSGSNNKEAILKIENVTTKGDKPLKNFSLNVHSGEIVAIAGVEGNGQLDLEYVVSGLKKPTSGSIKLKKTELIKDNYNKMLKRDKKTNIIYSSILSIVALVIIILMSLSKVMSNVIPINLMITLCSLLLIIIIPILIIYLVNLFRNIKDIQEFNIDKSDFIDISKLSTYKISQLGFSYIASDRHKHSMILDYTVFDNMQSRRLWDSKYVKFGVFRRKNIKKDLDIIIDKFDVRGARKGNSLSRSLSGGNQQKFIVGKEMENPHDFIIILQPTRGLDVGAIKNIHEKILQEKSKGKGILLISYELDEVIALADTIAVINEGQLSVVRESKNLSRAEIGVYMSHKKNGGENE
ncbi:ABC transporter ATP-binding protein [Mycoplasmopsis anatis]|uniref:ABC transporter ATP-binding protein n=1 Tax=Mycoplasmopsis anatis TaxID=171279 RepID=UPI001C4DFA94|nr:ABC transporter ATP-binding protein [Mycoplasmopsis anatis]MBW0594796.1 ABC transporter ATP-binding protein [Mycoplasmopsis anatis]MBW0595597.1 ABC transporter ATP-binding protein [Mycoplasmopsis anatis]MBW0598373.1 ABC transporter ATP-binding protein [Mycoplasmopsis anatis]MBW0601345.1 ABC transporter ATP-binding protein [Mycoplasmopsis anatis]MBW0602195.1 ABC transporter ATP-binding protein [Mycoplasmopsis anatis]